METRKIIVKKIDENFEDNPDENMNEKTQDEINEPDCSIYLGVRKYNYSNEPCEFVLNCFWEYDSVDSAFINLPYTDFEDLRNKLDFLIGGLTKENAE